MAVHRLLVLLATLVLGALSTWALASPWFLPVFLTALAVAIVLGLIAAATADESRPSHWAAHALAAIFIGSHKPNALISPSLSKWFQLAACYVVGMACSVIWLGRA